MPRYSWEGRSGSGAVVRGDIEAPSREAASQRVRGTGITVMRVDERPGGSGSAPVVTGGSEPPPVRPYRPGESLRDKLFYFGVAGVFTALAAGAAYVAPLHVYDCARDARGSVDCTVHRRVYGLVPRSDLHFSRILAVEIATGEYQASLSDRLKNLGRSQSWAALRLVCADGTRWQSIDSTWPMGRTISDLRDGISELLDAGAPAAYRGWTIEKVPLLISLVFLLPAGLMFLALVLKLVIPRAVVDRATASLEAAAARQHRERGR